MNWFAERRREWIEESVVIFEFINRRHIQRKFGVSAQVATWDIAEVIKRRPGFMEYDRVKKQYFLAKKRS